MDMMSEFNYLTFNVKGINNDLRRAQIFGFCKDKIKNNGIVLLQETHSCQREVAKWKKEWDAELYLNHGTSNSRGTLIAISKGFDIKVLKCIDDQNGRIQILTFEHKNKRDWWFLETLVFVYRSMPGISGCLYFLPFDH